MEWKTNHLTHCPTLPLVGPMWWVRKTQISYDLQWDPHPLQETAHASKHCIPESPQENALFPDFTVARGITVDKKCSLYVDPFQAGASLYNGREQEFYICMLDWLSPWRKKLKDWDWYGVRAKRFHYEIYLNVPEKNYSKYSISGSKLASCRINFNSLCRTPRDFIFVVLICRCSVRKRKALSDITK